MFLHLKVMISSKISKLSIEGGWLKYQCANYPFFAMLLGEISVSSIINFVTVGDKCLENPTVG